MTAIITVPPALDDQTFEQVLEQLAALPLDAELLIDARHTTWASPYGLTALLTLAQSWAVKPTLRVPENGDTALYWSRTNFFRYADQLFELQGTVPPAPALVESSTLLEITPIVRSDDVHTVVRHIEQKASTILTEHLHLESRAVMGFVMTLSELCQLVVEKAGCGGWVAAQNYAYRKQFGGRQIVQIAVCHAGLTVRDMLRSSGHHPMDDGDAIETEAIRGTSRFPDHGRGQGFMGVRGDLNRWDGKLVVRSGTARVALIPAWDDDVARTNNLTDFPGVQTLVMIPEKVER